MKWISKDFLSQPAVKKHFAIVIMGFLIGTLVYGYINFSGFQNIEELVSSGLLGVLTCYALHFSNRFIDRPLPWKKQPGLRLLAGIAVHLAIATSLVLGILWAYMKFVDTPSIFLEDADDNFVKIAILLFCAILIYNILYFAFVSYYEYSKGQVMEVKLKRKQAQLQLNALKSQLSPHFLFNSMNTLSSLFQKDTERAESFIRSLAGSYEYVLNNYESPLVTISEELGFVKAYCYLVRTRFGDHLNLDVNFPSEVLKSKVPPLTLQMLVENAVKHNVMEASQHLKIQMSVEDDKICVKNNKTMKRSKLQSLKIGLKNIASRYELLSDRSIEIIDDTDFTVILPLLR